MNISDLDVENDFGSFSQAPPPTPKEQAAMEKKKQAEQKRLEKMLKPKPVTAADRRAAKELADSVKHDKNKDSKAALFRKINRYKQEFPDRLKNVKIPRNFSIKTPIETMENVLEQIRMELRSRGSKEWANRLFVMSIGGFQYFTEHVANPLNLALSGPVADLKGTVVAQQDAWKDIIAELAVEYERYLASSPEKRLLLYTATLILTVHRANTTPRQATAAKKKQVSEELFQESLNLFNKDE